MFFFKQRLFDGRKRKRRREKIQIFLFHLDFMNKEEKQQEISKSGIDRCTHTNISGIYDVDYDDDYDDDGIEK